MILLGAVLLIIWALIYFSFVAFPGVLLLVGAALVLIGLAIEHPWLR